MFPVPRGPRTRGWVRGGRTGPACRGSPPSSSLWWLLLCAGAAAGCEVRPGEPIQPALDQLARSGGGLCQLLPGVHPVTAPIAVPANTGLHGAGSANTVLRSRMADPASIGRLCSWSGGNCAVITVNNHSRENITLAQFAIDGGLTPALRQWAGGHCGGFGIGVSDCPPCEQVGYPECKWNNFGILLWDYHAGGPVRNVLIDSVRVENASMGLHVLGGQNVTVLNSAFAWNGNGNAFFHNAYFLRMQRTRLVGCDFTDSSGHGLKITAQNDTLVRDCYIARNSWQGIWVGGEQGQPANYGLTIDNCTVEANGKNGIQLGGTNGFAVRRSVVRYHATVQMAGLAIDGSTDGVVEGGLVNGNAINILAENVRNVTVSGVGCDVALYGQPTCVAKTKGFGIVNSSCRAIQAASCG